ncbi:MAG: hypothetical protein HY727_08050 [Candidatus Rokubacteria bacterium]|nr:hypothetical protein [Candidatus Rokubacteria bacterium]
MTNTAPSPPASRPCSRCGEEPRLPRQRWGRACLTAAQRARRAARRAAHPHPGEPPAKPSALTPPSPTAEAEALDRYRRARAELDLVTRETDWRRSRYTPAQVLRPLVDAVTQAEAACRGLAVPMDALKDR